jgi:hypothetical protein
VIANPAAREDALRALDEAEVTLTSLEASG